MTRNRKRAAHTPTTFGDLPTEIMGRVALYLSDQQIKRYIQASEEIYTSVKNIDPKGAVYRQFHLGATLEGHEGCVYSAIHTQIKGQDRIISGSTDGSIKIWEPRSL